VALPHSAASTVDRLKGDPAYQAFWLLRVGFAVLPILFGLDKFFDVLAGGIIVNLLSHSGYYDIALRLRSARRRAHPGPPGEQVRPAAVHDEKLTRPRRKAWPAPGAKSPRRRVAGRRGRIRPWPL
jgi:hypothetical protein